MMSGVSAYSSSVAPYAASPASRRQQEAEQPFSVPESALRYDAPTSTQASQDAQSAQNARPARDPAADAIEFSRDYPQLLLSQSYAPPPVQQIQEAGIRLQDSATAASTATGTRATPGLGQELDAQAQGRNTAIPGQPAALPGAASAEGDGTENPEGAEGTEGENKPGEPDGADGKDMSNEEQAQVRELSNRDREVRAHEMAHQAVGGAYAGGASYEFQQGPDGQRYAVGGEVSIDMSPERDPEATVAKMQQVKAAAMAPAQPSGQDRSVAASATSTEMQARAELSAASAPGAAEGEGAEGADASAAEGESGAGETGAAAGATGGIPGIGGTEEPQSGFGDSVNGATSVNGANSAESGGMTQNPFVENYQQQNQSQTRSNPYQNISSGMNVLNLPNAYGAIDIVA